MPLLRINRHPPPLQLRLFAGACAVISGVAASRLWHRELASAAWGVGGLGAAVLLAGLLAPARLRGLYLAPGYAPYPVGFALSYAILAVLFYGVILPIGLAFRAFGSDPL